VDDTLDAFLEHPVSACAEALVEVNQALLANCAPESIKIVYSKAEAFSQCRRWLGDRLPGATLVPVESTAGAVQRAGKEDGTAAIGSVLAGQLYGVNVLFERVADRAGNITRFLVIASEGAKSTGDDKTSVAFTTAHRPGALVDVLDAFRRNGVNLSHIEKRPSRMENWRYTFIIDADGHETAESVKQSIEDARPHCVWIRVLGSYPRAAHVVG
jgi:chorismate mutase/prephenate dehydratase